MTVMAHIRRGLCRKFVVRGDCSVVKEPAPRTGLNCYRRGVEKGIGKCPFIHHDILRRFIQAVHRILTKVFSHLFQSTLYGIFDGIDIDIFSFSDFLVFHLPVEPHQDSAALYFC